MGCLCAGTSNAGTKVPINMWSNKKAAEATDNYNRIMNRTWYLIANSYEPAHNYEFMQESYAWIK